VEKSNFVFDIETIINFFSYTAISTKTDEVKVFVIWKNRNDLEAMLDHLDNEAKGLIGFNSLSFDYPVIHEIMKKRKHFLKIDGDQAAREIYRIAQETINKEWSQVYKPYLPQLDLFKVHHFDNHAKMTSLKKLEIALQMDNVEDMPHPHCDEVETQEVADQILSYNLNDVIATKRFWQVSIDKIKLRAGIRERYGIECMNYSDSKIGEELMLKMYCEHTGKEPKEVKPLRTKRSVLRFADCIPDYIKFETDEFNELLDFLKGKEVSVMKDSFKYSFTYRNFIFDLGTGGIHGCAAPKVYVSDDEKMIIDADVASLYPSLAIVNNLYPEHLGADFPAIYENEIVKPRIAAKRRGDKVMADGFKLSANSVYGKSNSEWSFLYDPLYTLKTTLAGQLSLCQLSEMLMIAIPELEMLQINTDGLTVIIPRGAEEKYREVCKKWEEITRLELEYVTYSKMVVRDVNNYLAISSEGKVKYKGAFKIHTEMIKDGEYHKAFNQAIVPLALSKYYVEGIALEDTIREHKNIYDFCKTFNSQGGWVCESLLVDENGNESDHRTEQKNNRYYISVKGRKFRKVSGDRKIDIEASNPVTIFNHFVEKPFDEYDVDYEYYINECYKIVDTISGEKERLQKEREIATMLDKRSRQERNYVKFCVEKLPTRKQYEAYRLDWLVEKYGEVTRFKPSPADRKKASEDQVVMSFDEDE